MKVIAPSQIDEILYALNSQIAVAGGESVSLVVIGGAALAAMGLVHRTTEDVDVLGEIVLSDHKLIIKEIQKFPDWLIEAAIKVQRDFDLLENWLNFKPSSYFRTGLPEGFQERLVEKKYGDYLRIFFVDRMDQIHFKLYAAVDVGPYEPRHLQDLIALEPSDDEMLMAARWVKKRESSERFQKDLQSLLRNQGHENIAERV